MQTSQNTTRKSDPSLDVEPQPEENLPEDEPMESCGSDGEDHEMEQEDENDSVYEPETETTESDIEYDGDNEIG